jgi:hypothetical protein
MRQLQEYHSRYGKERGVKNSLYNWNDVNGDGDGGDGGPFRNHSKRFEEERH